MEIFFISVPHEEMFQQCKWVCVEDLLPFLIPAQLTVGPSVNNYVGENMNLSCPVCVRNDTLCLIELVLIEKTTTLVDKMGAASNQDVVTKPMLNYLNHMQHEEEGGTALQPRECAVLSLQSSAKNY